MEQISKEQAQKEVKELREKYECENNKYNELYLKVKIIEILEVLCKKELE